MAGRRYPVTKIFFSFDMIFGFVLFCISSKGLGMGTGGRY